MQCNASSTVRTTRHMRRSFFAGCHAAAGLPWSQTSAVSGGGGGDAAGAEPEDTDYYLVGQWSAIAVDPSLWGFDGAALTHLVVKDATRRLVRLRAAGDLPGFTAEQHALPPPIWGGEASAPVGQGPARPVPGWVEAQAKRQQQRFGEKLAAATAAQPPRSRVRVHCIAFKWAPCTVTPPFTKASSSFCSAAGASVSTSRSFRLSCFTVGP